MKLLKNQVHALKIGSQQETMRQFSLMNCTNQHKCHPLHIPTTYPGAQRMPNLTLHLELTQMCRPYCLQSERSPDIYHLTNNQNYGMEQTIRSFCVDKSATPVPMNKAGNSSVRTCIWRNRALRPLKVTRTQSKPERQKSTCMETAVHISEN